MEGKPSGLDELRAVTPGLDRIAAAQVFVAAHKDEIKEALRIRNDDVRAMVAELGPAETARRTGIPLPTVKSIKGGA